MEKERIKKMAKVVAKFEKVSFEQFRKDFLDCFSKVDMANVMGMIPDENGFDTAIRKVYDAINLPKRGTVGSAGYDFFTPVKIKLAPHQTIKIPTGIRCRIDSNWVLKCYPRSGLGFKYRMQLNNTVGIIDSDYYGADNEGHIMAKITNDTNESKTIEIESGKGFMQGIFVEYGITEDDTANGIRTGGFGHTDNK